MNWRTQYKTYLQKSGRSENTVEAYLSDLNQFRLWFERVNGEQLLPARVTGVDCLDFRKHQLDVEQVAPSTWNRRRISMMVFTEWALEYGYLNEDPMVDVSIKPAEELPPRWLDEAQYRAVIRHLDKEVNRAQTEYEQRTALMYRAIVSLMLFAGLRVGEVCDLKRKDITLSERKGGVWIRDGKGGKAARLPLNKKARRALAAWLDYARQNVWEQIKAETDDMSVVERIEHERYWLWIGRKYEPLSPRSVQAFVKNMGELLDIHFLTPHSFRHTCIRRLLVVKKVPVNIAQKFARHSRVETTLSYAGVSWDDLERAAEEL